MKNLMKIVTAVALISSLNLIGAEKRALQVEFLELRNKPHKTAEQQARYDELRDIVAPHLKIKEQAMATGELIRERRDLLAIEERTPEQQERLEWIESALSDRDKNSGIVN